MRRRDIVLALIIAILLGLCLEAATAHDSEPPRVCISAVGPVDSVGHGDTTVDVSCR